MPRRRQFADIADGISGHFVRDFPWDTTWWPLGAVARAYGDGAGSDIAFDMMAGTSDPDVGTLRDVARRLPSDLYRHLEARRVPVDWLQSAAILVHLEPAIDHPEFLRVRCRIAITDDRGVVHTSTRHVSARLPRPRPFQRMIDWFVRLQSDPSAAVGHRKR